jgi:hypothetical protein
MGLKAVFAAIDARWTAQGLSGAGKITGGIYLHGTQKNADMPYCVASLIGSTVAGRAARVATGSKHTQYNLSQIQLRIHHKTDIDALADLVELVRTAFDWAPLSISGADTIYMKFNAETMISDMANPGAYIWALTYDVQWAEQVDASPS